MPSRPSDDRIACEGATPGVLVAEAAAADVPHVEPPPKPWSAYILECMDGTLYCGVAIDVDQRIRDHDTPKGAKCVRGHGGVKQLLWQQEFKSQTEAMRAEIWIKAQPKRTKLGLVSGRTRIPPRALMSSAEKGGTR